ncbi:LysR family transcriptional regulator [Pseudomonas granadensis]|uniref:LysR family transcriptional regulator n=1 Tax=Pseudomonas granadensis TaxID=1421430 RepID=UPI0019D2A047|nr:LysR family transcriptional regulator [Pseudomonas granadensis]MBN6776821.1 LysR family transcriptional regulator [Pseudomonas granadensis]MBN6808019.1 LysR family transcriptional regulator [Pseudomonas granadensis]MBN6834729.1 LysR family transcriptional regulator [Pseudomonas granadensis]MBN6842242.1 LysR family transcriptional regulator [Pseudomonas granadensis]MBN6870926.1 LysR family transcriptional regulator [Pseudomonas granadensis]
MSFTEPAGRAGTSDYRSPEHKQETWLGHAAAIDSEVAQYFLVSARCGCFMQAARSLNVRSTLLRKQLAQLEQQLQHSLFSFQGSALSLTREGQQLQARLITLAFERKLPVIEQPLIRLAVAESILHDILGRDLIALLRRNASVRLEIIALDSELSLRAVSADIVLWLAHGSTPHPGPAFAISEPQRLACLDYLPHIAKRYSRVTARPETPDDLADFMLVQWQHDRQIDSFRPWNELVEQRLAGVVQMQSYELMLEMIRCSACIGLLPAYMSRFDRGLIALPGLFAEPMQLQAWLAVNAESEGLPGVQTLTELIHHTFAERREWFQP